MTTMPIESLAYWRIHLSAQLAAEAAGACWRIRLQAGA